MAETDVDDEVAALLRRADQRYTSGRRRLVAALQEGGGPLTITQILAVDGSLAQSSVYRNLTILEDAGAVTRIVTRDDFARYELAEGLTEHHHHLICESCGSIRDVVFDAEIEHALEDALDAIGRAEDFVPHGHTIDVYGTCGACR